MFVLWGLVALAGCDDEAPLPLPSASVVRPPSAGEGDELPEGTLVVFGLRMPIRSVALDQSSRTADIEVSFPFEQVASYMRKRITAKSVNVGPSATVFDDCTFVGVDSPDRYDVTVRALTNETRITLRKRRPVAQPVPAPAP